MWKQRARNGQGKQSSFVRAGAVTGGGGSLRPRAGLALGLAAAALLAGGPAHALSLSLTPASVTQNPTVDFSLTLSVGGFGDASTRLTAFTVKLAYDPTLLQFGGATFGSLLGVSPTTAQTNATAASGVVTLTENSLLSRATLESTQPGTFDLATLTFHGLTPGAGTVSLFTDNFTQLVLTDLSLAAFTPPLPAVPITIAPEPTSSLLLMAGLATLAARARLKRPTSGLLEDGDSAP